MKAAHARSIEAPSPNAGAPRTLPRMPQPSLSRGGCVRARLGAPELRAIERLGLAGFLAVGDVDGPLADQMEIMLATWVSAPKRLDEARMHSPVERVCRVSLWTTGERHRGRANAVLRPRLEALG